MKGMNINGYTLLKDFSTAGGGLCQWTIAEKGGTSFFLKEFLSPKYPSDSVASGSHATKEKKLARCHAFEQRHLRLKKAIGDCVSAGGNLITTIDFFQWKNKYYKVTELVNDASLKPSEISRLPMQRKVLILKTLAHSLRLLHKKGIVHGDLKPDNILIKATEESFYVAKLIDFDNSYFSGEPPEQIDDVVGDMVYYSPELGRYVMRDPPAMPPVLGSDLTTASDIFALGLIYLQYLIGKLPSFPEKYQYAHKAIDAGQTLKAESDAIPEKLHTLAQQMLMRKPSDRPSIDVIFDALKPNDYSGAAEKPASIPAPRLRGKLLDKTGDIKPPTSIPSSSSMSAPTPGLKGKMTRKKP